MPVVESIESIASITEQALLKPEVIDSVELNQLSDYQLTLLPVPAPPPFIEQTSLPPVFVDQAPKGQGVGNRVWGVGKRPKESDISQLFQEEKQANAKIEYTQRESFRNFKPIAPFLQSGVPDTSRTLMVTPDTRHPERSAFDTVATAKFVEVEPGFNDASVAPGVESETELKPQAESEAVVDEEVPKSQPEPLGQWLGQTDAVYYSYSFHHNDESKVDQQPIAKDEDLKQYLVSTPLNKAESVANDEALNFISEDTTEAEQHLLENKDVEQRNEPTPSSIDDEAEAEKQLASSISDDEDLEQYLEATLLFEGESEANSKSPDSQPIPLFDDEDLARYLNSATLFDDDILKQKLGIAPEIPVVANIEPESAVREKVISKLHSGLTEPTSKDLAQLSLTKEHGDESKVEQPLFADEDLRQFLSSTPLMSDDIFQQKLN